MDKKTARYCGGERKSLRLFAVLSLGLLLQACGQEEVTTESPVRPLPVVRVGDAGEIEGRSFPGRARATQEVDLSFRVDGPLITLPILVGDEVSQGDLLARIDPRDYEVRLRNAEGQLQRARAALDRADSEYRRLQGIHDKDPQLVSEVQLERAREAYELAVADSSALQASVDAAQDELDYTFLKAPFDGSIVATYVENFEYVQSRQRVARLIDRRRIEFVFQVPETLITHAPYIEQGKVTFDVFPGREIAAELLEIGSEASELTRTYPVTLIMDQPDDIEILPGMAGKVRGQVRAPDREDGARIVLPVAAVFSPQAGDGSFVWVVDSASNRVTRRDVVLGDLSSGGVAIQSGLADGEVVAVAGVNFLSEGQEVRPVFE